MTSYFITGGAGFIGSHVVDRLLAGPGATVVAYDNLSNSARTNPPSSGGCGGRQGPDALRSGAAARRRVRLRPFRARVSPAHRCDRS